MLREKWEQILQGQDIRQNLSSIRQELKEAGRTKQFLTIIEGSEDRLISLLTSEDAKSRKNTALLMGDLGDQKYLVPLWEAYKGETQRFVRSSYLKALGSLDYRVQLEELKEQLERLKDMETTAENQKHVMEEMRELSDLIVRMEGVQKRSFIGWNEKHHVLLLTNRNYTEQIGKELAEHASDAEIKPFGAGVMAKVSNLRWVREIRTYQELFFIIKGLETCPLDPDQAAEVVVKSDLLRFLSENHDGEMPFYFRTEMKSGMEPRQKSTFIKKMTAQIEKLSDRRLINTKDNYETELRLIENKKGHFIVLIKLFTLKDKRFSYRQEVIPMGIRPVNAALTVMLTKAYMKENAQVLDPFCGTGTMLIERNKVLMANTTYGVDIQEEAIIKARKNTEHAGQIIHYINRDFFRFQHEYLFDEVITDMPFQIGRITEEDIFEIYMQFFKTVPAVLKEGATLILYTHNRDMVCHFTAQAEFQIVKEFEISRREGTYVQVIKYKA